jgi:hypothetical protein
VKTVRKLQAKLEADEQYKQLFGDGKLNMQSGALRPKALSQSVAMPLSKLKGSTLNQSSSRHIGLTVKFKDVEEPVKVVREEPAVYVFQSTRTRNPISQT